MWYSCCFTGGVRRSGGGSNCPECLSRGKHTFEEQEGGRSVPSAHYNDHPTLAQQHCGANEPERELHNAYFAHTLDDLSVITQNGVCSGRWWSCDDFARGCFSLVFYSYDAACTTYKSGQAPASNRAAVNVSPWLFVELRWNQQQSKGKRSPWPLPETPRAVWSGQRAFDETLLFVFLMGFTPKPAINIHTPGRTFRTAACNSGGSTAQGHRHTH